MLLKVRNAGMHGKEFLRPAGVLESELASFLLPGGPMRLFNEVIAPRSRDDLDVLHSVEHWKFTNGCSITPELVGVDHVWDVVIHQKPLKKSLGGLGVSPSLSQKVQHCARIIDGPPSPEFSTTDLNADLVKTPPGIEAGFPVPECFGEERG